MLSPLPMLEIDLRPDRTRVSVALRGEMDTATTPAVTAAVEDLLVDGWRDLVVDVRELAFMDSTGVSLLVALARRAVADGWSFAIVSAPGPVDRVLALTGADELLGRVPAVTAP